MTLRFDNAFVRDLPPLHARVRPTPVSAPRLVAWSREVAAMLGLAEADLDPVVFAGNALWPGMEPWAAAYGGHQFGRWAGQLGDGRAIGLGEAVTATGERWELQLKGAGPTPYSRGGDGRAVLRSSIREFLCSEAMHHLGVPTTRALCLVATGDPVVRDMFYDGHPAPEPGAVVCRVAPSFVRFGSFELPAARGDAALLQRLLDFVLRRDYPGYGPAEFFEAVCTRTAELVAHWMRVGFVHGVMNTDNMSILGLTIDYGPYGWIDAYDPGWTPNTTDAQGRRYRFGHQPAIAGWNLSRLADALSLVMPEATLEAGLQAFVSAYDAADRRSTAAKLGLVEATDADLQLMADLRDLLLRGEVDMTLFFRALGALDPAAPAIEALGDVWYDEARKAAVAPALAAWLERWAQRIRADGTDPAARRAAMDAANPLYVMRNYLAQEAIDRAEAGDDGGIHDLLAVMRDPYVVKPGQEAFARRRPDWARNRAGCSMLSCSS